MGLERALEAPNAVLSMLVHIAPARSDAWSVGRMVNTYKADRDDEAEQEGIQRSEK